MFTLIAAVIYYKTVQYHLSDSLCVLLPFIFNFILFLISNFSNSYSSYDTQIQLYSLLIYQRDFATHMKSGCNV